MKTISTSQLRSRTRSLVRTLEKGHAVSLTYRGHKLANIRPVKLKNGVRSDDPLYRFHLQAAREQARRGAGIPAQDARKLMDEWASR